MVTEISAITATLPPPKALAAAVAKLGQTQRERDELRAEMTAAHSELQRSTGSAVPALEKRIRALSAELQLFDEMATVARAEAAALRRPHAEAVTKALAGAGRSAACQALLGLTTLIEVDAAIRSAGGSGLAGADAIRALLPALEALQ